MLKFKEFDLLNENMNKARSVLRQAGADETDPNFLKLRELLKNNLGYTGKFTEWMFLQKVDFNRLENLYNRIKSEKLSNPIDQFNTPEEVIDHLIRNNSDVVINQILNSIPARTREFIKNNREYKDLENFLRQNSNKKDIFIDFFSKKGGRYGDYDKSSLIEELIDDLEKIANSKSINDISNLSKSSKDVKLVFEDDKMLMVAVNYDGIKEIGSNYWCIVEDEDTFNEYVFESEPRIQLVVFLKEKIPFIDDRSVLGITWSLRDKDVMATHWEDDSEHSLNKKFIELLKSLNSYFYEIIPTIYDVSETDWIYSIESLFIPELLKRIKEYKEGKEKKLKKLIINWLEYNDDYPHNVEKIINVIEDSGLKLNFFTWDYIIALKLYEIVELDKKLLNMNIFECYQYGLMADSEKPKFFNWLISNGYNLLEIAYKSNDPRNIMNIIDAKITTIDKVYKNINFNSITRLNNEDYGFVLDWIRDNDLNYLLSKKDRNVKDVLHTLFKQSEKFEDQILDIISSSDIKDEKFLKKIFMEGTDSIKMALSRNMIPKMVLDEFDITFTKKVNPEKVQRTKRSKKI
jgi:hypothetical protein